MGSPGPVEILRAAQKDNIFIEKFHRDIQDVAEGVLGHEFSLRWRKWLKYSSVGAYHCLTTLAGFQTLGEEYAGLVQTDATNRKAPNKKMIATMIGFHIFGLSILERVFEHLGNFLSSQERFLQDGGCDSGQLAHSNQVSQLFRRHFSGGKLAHAARHCLPFLLRLHLVIFYLQGKFYHLSKRLTGIRYVLVRKWFANQDANSKQNLKYLRLMSAVNLILTALHDGVIFFHSQAHEVNKAAVKIEGENSSAIDSSRKCSLCLEIRKNPSLTPCGHLFCWECIMDWLQTKEECPICRTEAACSRIVPLQNHV